MNMFITLMAQTTSLYASWCIAVHVFVLTMRAALQKADIWSCGIILYAMLYGQHPFQADASFAQKVVRGDYPIPADIPVSPSCLGLLKGILVPDPKARMGMMDIKQHPWFLQGRLHHVCCQIYLLATAPSKCCV